MIKPKQIKGYHAVLLAGLLVTTASLPAFAEDYTPPPLFGGSATVTKAAPDPEPAQPAPVVTVGKPHLPDLPPPIATTPKSFPSTETLVRPTTPPPEPAIVSGSQPKNDDTMTVDGLLNHPADRVDPRAQAVINKPALSSPRRPGLAQPILDEQPKTVAAKPEKPKPTKPKAVTKIERPKVEVPLAKVATVEETPKPAVPVVDVKPAPTPPEPVATKPEPASVVATTSAPVPSPEPALVATAPTSPAMDKTAPPSLLDYAMPDLSKETPVNPSPVPTIAAGTDPIKETVIRPGITSPSPTVKKIIQNDPKVMVYSRDKTTGEFKRVNRDDVVQHNKGWTQNFEVQKMPKPAEVQAAPTPKDPDDTSIAWPPRMPPPLPTKTPPVSSTESVAKELATMVPPLGVDALAPRDIATVPNMPAAPIATVHATKLPPTTAEIPANPAPKAASIMRNTPVSSAASKLAAIAPAAASATAPTVISLHYKAEATDLDNAKRMQMDKTILKALMNDKSAKLEIRAYAAAKAGAPTGSDRRTALNRGLAVREYLVSQGVPGDRMDMRIMGQAGSGATPERVDLTAQ